MKSLATFAKCSLFAHMTEIEISECIKCSKAEVCEFDKNEIIFTQLDTPLFLYILIEGSVSVCKDSISGKRETAVTFSEGGDIFGEVYVFLPNHTYDYYTLTTQKTSVLQIPKSYFYEHCSNTCGHHAKLTKNMLGILAQKAYYLTQKLQLLSSGNLRQKIAKYLLDNADARQSVSMRMNREEFASFLNVARPSLSRELVKMKDEGLILLRAHTIYVPNLEMIENLL